MSRRSALAACLVGVLSGVLLALFGLWPPHMPSSILLSKQVSLASPPAPPSPSPEPSAVETPAAAPQASAQPEPEPSRVPGSEGAPYGSAVNGLLTFRGNPTRTFYGTGPVPSSPTVAWRHPAAGSLCGPSTVGGETTQWCGTGWTGQPAVFERQGRTWVVFGAYDHRIHFLDAATGTPLLPPFATGDIIKGSVTVDPDGFPLVFTGSRDGFYRVLAIDRDQPVELWRLAASDVSPTLWNDDWDGSGLIIDDHLFIGGENSQFHIVALNRGYDENGLVTVDPKLVFNAPGWDQQLLRDLGDTNVSIESSVTMVGETVYFANSGGLIQGWDVSGLRAGRVPTLAFRFWTGDDTDATIVADDEGMLYVASEWERFNARAADVGQIMKLDPRRPENPLVWSVDDQGPGVAGVWGTPALHRDVLYAATDAGRLLGIDRATGAIRWSKTLEGATWQSPVVVDDVLLQGDCGGTMHAYDVADTTLEPPELWSMPLVGCIESTPAVWNGSIYVGTRAGQFLAITG